MNPQITREDKVEKGADDIDGDGHQLVSADDPHGANAAELNYASVRGRTDEAAAGRYSFVAATFPSAPAVQIIG